MGNPGLAALACYPSADPDEAFATYDTEVNVPENGRVYQQKYIGHFRQRAGKLVYLSEYLDPTKLVEAFGKPDHSAN